MVLYLEARIILHRFVIDYRFRGKQEKCMISINLSDGFPEFPDVTNLFSETTTLFNNDARQIYWLGIPSEAMIHCNSYLIVDGDEGIIVDPGATIVFDDIKRRVEEIIPLDQIVAITASHQDPDVCGSLFQWVKLIPSVKLITSKRADILMRFFGKGEYKLFDIFENSTYSFKSGRSLTFIQAPFMHFPGAFTIYDNESGYLFSGDIWAALDFNWKLVVEDFDEYVLNLNLFHLDYIASSVAAKGFIRNLEKYVVNAILPQHGSLIAKRDVNKAIEYINSLVCGLDILYPDIF
jgi:flavorubredoxin